MTIVVKLVITLLIGAIIALLERYARQGDGLSREGRRFIRLAYTFVAAVALLTVWLS